MWQPVGMQHPAIVRCAGRDQKGCQRRDASKHLRSEKNSSNFLQAADTKVALASVAQARNYLTSDEADENRVVKWDA